MVDRLHGLRHDPIVRGHDQSDEVSDLGSAGTHSSKRLVTGSVEERHAPAIHLDAIGPDVLGNTALLLVRHMGLTDHIKQGGLAVIDMAHNSHHRRAQRQFFVALLLRVSDLQHRLDVKGHIFHRVVEVCRHQGGGLRIQHLIDRRHDPEPYQFLNHFAGLHPQLMGQITNGYHLGDTNHPFTRLRHGDLGVPLLLPGQQALLSCSAGEARIPLGGFNRVRFANNLALLGPFGGSAESLFPSIGYRRARGTDTRRRRSGLGSRSDFSTRLGLGD